jgi:succinate-semialdehyde dehydrogenase/glutarate-semialdehyde dehydrogenase
MSSALHHVTNFACNRISRCARTQIGCRVRDRVGKRSALGGTVFEPTVLTDVTTDMVITREENFGPVAPLCRFNGDAEAKAF